MPAVIPTKGNLLAAKRSLTLARLGYELMDRKRNILIREMMALIDRSGALQKQIDTVFRQAYADLQQSNITLGICEEIAHTVPVDQSLTLKSRSIMGVEIPNVSSDSRAGMVPYGFIDTNSMLDRAYLQFLDVKKLITDLSEVETGVIRLAFAIKKTQKRANALKNIIIPNFVSTIKNITDALEEKEREEFVRLKVIKAQGESKAKKEQEAASYL